MNHHLKFPGGYKMLEITYNMIEISGRLGRKPWGMNISGARKTAGKYSYTCGWKNRQESLLMFLFISKPSGLGLSPVAVPAPTGKRLRFPTETSRRVKRFFPGALEKSLGNVFPVLNGASI